MAETQAIDYDALAKQHGAIASQPAAVDYDALAAQHGAISSTAATVQPTHSASISAASPPGVWERMVSAVPVLGRMEHGLETGFASPRTTSTGQALAKRPETMNEERAIAPEQLMTPEQRQAHPIATGIGEFVGGMTTPDNMLLMATSGMLGKVPGAAGAVLPRIASAAYAAQTMRAAYSEVPDLRAAYNRGDTVETERIGTHILLGAVMAGLGIKHATTGEQVSTTKGPVTESIYEGYRRAGQFFSNLRNKNVTLDHISESATGLYNSIRQDIITHQEALRADGVRTIQNAIDADKAALMNTYRGSIQTGKVIGEAAKMLAATEYQMKPAEQSLFNRIANKPEMTLEEAKLIRTAVGRMAYERSSIAPEAKAVFTAAYNELGEGMKGRIKELYGNTRPYEHYNNQFNASFELEDGISGEMKKSLQGMDRHASIPKLEKFSDANLTELQEQMRKIGLSQQATSLEKAQRHARSLVGAYDVNNGKYMSGIYRLFMQNPRQAWPGIAVMLAAHGLKIPFPGPQIAGAIIASGHIGTRARAEAARVGQELRATLPPEMFRTRTQAKIPETFTPLNPDEGWRSTQPETPPENQFTNPKAAKAEQIKRIKGGK
jgi:hypothetical protein